MSLDVATDPYPDLEVFGITPWQSDEQTNSSRDLPAWGGFSIEGQSGEAYPANDAG